MSELIDDVLDGVTGGAADPAPTATGSNAVKCPVCHIATLNISSRDTSVTCPNMKCRAKFSVSGGKLGARMG